MPAMRDTARASPFCRLADSSDWYVVGAEKVTVAVAVALRWVEGLLWTGIMWALPLVVRWGRGMGEEGLRSWLDGAEGGLFDCEGRDAEVEN